MPQFAVHKHRSRSGTVPFIVQIESTRLEHPASRVVMALVRREARSPVDHPLTPWLTIGAELVSADPFNIATVPSSRLGPPILILPEPGQDRIIRALDEVTSRA